jgi:hypothetical protein
MPYRVQDGPEHRFFPQFCGKDSKIIAGFTTKCRKTLLTSSWNRGVKNLVNHFPRIFAFCGSWRLRGTCRASGKEGINKALRGKPENPTWLFIVEPALVSK